MKRKTHPLVLVLIYLGLITILILLFHDPRFTAKETTVSGGPGQDSVNIADTRVRCESIIMLGWPTDRAYPDEDAQSSSSWDAELPSMSAEAYDAFSADFQQECTERRDTYLGFIIMIVVPTTALLSVAISRSSAQRR
ncbi:hypothetical protein [Brevibacterium zhoupengii]|uniref:hypothetical protein n=1 Tax=Brevibacterium zhoupengii TaxID=2898795 RepID=UPI001E47D360|nr:hypothetical protein [Brevibacterium zhoupengii]